MIPLKPDTTLLFYPSQTIPRYRFLLLLALPVLILSTSCGSTSKKDKVVLKDSTLITLPEPGFIPEAERNFYRARCEQWFNTYILRSQFNGGVIVAKNGNVIYEKYRGTAHLNGNDTINANTPLHIASVSKTFTGMAILKLWQDGKLNLDDEASLYLAGFNYPGVTIRTLLNHRSGLPNYVYFMEDFGWDQKVNIYNKDILKFMIDRKSEIKNIGKPDRSFSYCNTNYALLALIIEKVAAQSYPEYMKKTFFHPLSMANSFVFTQADSFRITPSYDWRGIETPINYLDHVYGDKNIYSTPADLLKWDRFLSSRIVFKDQTLEEAFKPYSNEKPGIRNYGLGWRMNIYPNGKKMIYHNGWWHGNNSVFIRLRDENATIIALGNRYSTSVYKAKHLANIFDEYFEGSDEESESTTRNFKRRSDTEAGSK